MLFTTVIAHFTLIGSREQASLAGYRFWPISGASTLRVPDDCLKIKPTTAIKVPSGPYTIRWEIADGAHHIGMCKAYLIDTKTGDSQLVGQEDNCVSTKQALTVDLSKHTCTSCVIKATVDADHLISKIEHYDSCLDVTFDTAPSSVPPTTEPHNSEPPAATESTVETTTNNVGKKSRNRSRGRGRRHHKRRYRSRVRNQH